MFLVHGCFEKNGSLLGKKHSKMFVGEPYYDEKIIVVVVVGVVVLVAVIVLERCCCHGTSSCRNRYLSKNTHLVSLKTRPRITCCVLMGPASAGAV